MRVIRYFAPILVLFGLAAARPSHVRGDELEKKVEGLLEKKLDGLTQSLAGLLAQRNERKVAVGEFIGNKALNATAGPAIALALTEALGRNRIATDDQASIEIRGDYLVKGNASETSVSLKIRFQILDTIAGNEKLADTEIDLFDAATIARLTGATGDLSGASNAERLRKLGPEIRSPKVKLDPAPDGGSARSKVSAPGKPYAVELLVKSETGLEPRDASPVNGRAFVALKRSEVYAVRLYNDSPLDAAVELSIDGVNIFKLHENSALRSARIIIPAGQSQVVRGYAISNRVSKEFLVAGVDAEVDGRLLPKGHPSLGTITAMFSAAWKEGDAPPRDEPDGPITEGDDDTRTIPGTEFNNTIRQIPVEIGKPRAQVSIRYNKSAR